MEGSRFLSRTACDSTAGFGEIAPVYANIQERRVRDHEPAPPLLLCPCDTFFHRVKATGAGEMKVGACPSAGLGDRCLVGSVPAACSEKLRCQMKDLLSGEKQGAPTTYRVQDSPPCRGGEQGLCSHRLRLRCHQPLQGTGVNTHRPRGFRCRRRDDVHARSGFFFAVLTLAVCSALPTPWPPEPAGCRRFSPVP